MKRFLLLLLLLPLVSAQPTDWFQSGIVSTELNVSSSIDLVSRGPSSFVEVLTADVVFVPQNSDFLAVRSFSASPSAAVTGDRARFVWNTPDVGRLSFGYSSLVEIANDVPRVRSKIPFPMSVPRGFEKYVKPSQNIDSNHPAVIGQAHLLAQGEDDLFVVVSKIGFWVKNNVDYNLSSLTAEVSQPASWVLENRFGVCDEITSLFVAMLRSLKIPARFVSGLAFTNSLEFANGWGAHGWAEVYFPGVGWVPFDPTFGEFGWVDPGHIKLKDSLDPQEPTTVFEWKARDVDVKVSDLVLSAQMVKAVGNVPFELKAVVSALRPRVGFGSFNGVLLDVENFADYYVASEFSLTPVSDLEILNGEHQQVVVAPNGRSRAFWKVKVRESLDSSFQYELPLQVYTIRKDVFDASFASGKWDVVFSSADIDSQIDALSVRHFDVFDLSCVLVDDMVWSDSGRVDCLIQNRKSELIGVNVCFSDCRIVSVPAGGASPVSFDVPSVEPGPHEVSISASLGDLRKKAVLTLVRLDPPHVVVRDVVIPDSVVYGDSFTLSFTLGRESVSFPQNVTVEVKGSGARAFVDVGELLVDQEVRVTIRSDQLFSSSPDFIIDVSYKDPFEREYGARTSATLSVSDVPWYKRMFGWLVDLF